MLTLLPMDQYQLLLAFSPVIDLQIPPLFTTQIFPFGVGLSKLVGLSKFFFWSLSEHWPSIFITSRSWFKIIIKRISQCGLFLANEAY